MKPFESSKEGVLDDVVDFVPPEQAVGHSEHHAGVPSIELLLGSPGTVEGLGDEFSVAGRVGVRVLYRSGGGLPAGGIATLEPYDLTHLIIVVPRRLRTGPPM